MSNIAPLIQSRPMEVMDLLFDGPQKLATLSAFHARIAAAEEDFYGPIRHALSKVQGVIMEPLEPVIHDDSIALNVVGRFGHRDYPETISARVSLTTSPTEQMVSVHWCGECTPVRTMNQIISGHVSPVPWAVSAFHRADWSEKVPPGGSWLAVAIQGLYSMLGPRLQPWIEAQPSCYDIAATSLTTNDSHINPAHVFSLDPDTRDKLSNTTTQPETLSMSAPEPPDGFNPNFVRVYRWWYRVVATDAIASPDGPMVRHTLVKYLLPEISVDPALAGFLSRMHDV